MCRAAITVVLNMDHPLKGLIIYVREDNDSHV